MAAPIYAEPGMAAATLKHPSERRRVIFAVGIGAVAAVVASSLLIWQLAVLVAWIALASTFLASVAWSVHDLDAAGTCAAATAEDDSRNAARALMVFASMAGLAGVFFGLARTSSVSTGTEIALVATAIATVVTSWAVLHCVFMLRYAHLYYTDPIGGVEFPGDEEPSYRDFAYLAFTVGMTYQVADTDITQSNVRRTLLGHALLSFVFGAVIIAVSINVVASFV